MTTNNMLLIRTESGKEESVVKSLKELPGTYEARLFCGAYDIRANTRTKSKEEFDSYEKKVKEIPGVTEVKSILDVQYKGI